ncbi:PCRF domain-containing protein [Spirillospora sp. NPDC050679]
MDAAAQRVLDEHAGIEARLADPAVNRDFVLARRLRRCLEALAVPHDRARRLRRVHEDLAEARDLAAADPDWRPEVARLTAEHTELARALRADLAGRDPRDPYDAVLLIQGERTDGGEFLVGRLVDGYHRRVAAHGWRAERMDDVEPRSVVAGGAALWITGGDTGPAPWALLKGENGLHATPGSATARVSVLPDLDPFPPPWREEEIRLDLFCTRMPGAPTSMRAEHLPSGRMFWSVSREHRRAAENALRGLRALLAAERIGPEEPAHRWVRRTDEVVRVVGPFD